MAIQRKLKVFFGFLSYGSNGGTASEAPCIRKWYTDVRLKIAKDDRIYAVEEETIADTPVPMVRNAFVIAARKANADVLVMIDSDQSPNQQAYLPDFKPFWDSSFEYLYQHYSKGPVVVFAPYCGPPPHSQCYAFRWSHDIEQGDATIIAIEPYSRHEAARMRGIQECAAGPTGLIMYDMRCFELVEPSHKDPEQVLDEFKNGLISKRECLRCLTTRGWFDYEWTSTMDQKQSTEDVMNLRNISLAGQVKYGYNPVLCNWDSPAGHWKPWCVEGRPRIWDVKQISETFRRVVESDSRTDEVIVDAKNHLGKESESFWSRYEQIHGAQDHTKEVEHFVTGLSVAKPSKNFPGVVEYADGTLSDHKTSPKHLESLADFIRQRAADVAPSNLHVVEVGSWKGDSAIAMLKAADNVLLRCVDTWQGSDNDCTGELAATQDVFAAFMENVVAAGVGDRIAVVKKDSVTAAVEINDKVDVLFLDANHGYDEVRDDIHAWLPKIMDTGWLIGHDYYVSQFPGLTKAVDEIFGNDVKRYGTTPDGSFWVVKFDPEQYVEWLHRSA